MSTSNEEPNLRSCSASDLSNFLVKHRFGGDEVATTTFLLQSMESLPNALETASKLQQQQQQIEIEETPAPDYGKEIVPTTSFSFLTPRGKMETTLYEQGLQARNAKNEVLFLPIGSVQQIIIFPKSTTTNNNKTAFVVLIRLNETETTPTFKNKKLSQICWTMEGASLSEERVANLCACLGVDSAIQVASSSSNNGWSFQSHQDTATSTTTGGRPFVKCYHGVNDGVLYPLKEGLLFFKPPLFVARSEMASISCGRGGNSGSSRYVDMVVQVERDTIEFTNIHREELQGLNDYIHKVLIPAMQQDVTHSSVAGKDDTTVSEPVDLVETNNEDDDEDSDEDEDYQSGNSDDEGEDEEEEDDIVDEDEGACLEDEDETESESELPPPAKKRSRRG